MVGSEPDAPEDFSADLFGRTDFFIRNRFGQPGRPPLDPRLRKRPISIRLSPDVLKAFRDTGPGWQTRIDQVLREWLQSHPKAP